MIFPILNLHFVRMLPHKLQLSWQNSSWEEFFCKFNIFQLFLIILPWKRAWILIITTLNQLCLGVLCAKFSWNWASSSCEDFEYVKRLWTDGRQAKCDQKSCLESLFSSIWPYIALGQLKPIKVNKWELQKNADNPLIN